MYIIAPTAFQSMIIPKICLFLEFSLHYEMNYRLDIYQQLLHQIPSLLLLFSLFIAEQKQNLFRTYRCDRRMFW